MAQVNSFPLIYYSDYNFNAMIYSSAMTLREARKIYFELSHFPVDGGYEERWIKVKVWRIPIWLPNTNGRVKAVKLHDLHHVLTEYPTTWRGEAEISAWEIGSDGLRRYWAGWPLDLMNVAQGLIVNPRGVYRGFMRGRSSKNLYAEKFSDDLLNRSVGEFRERLRLNDPPKRPTAYDLMLFIFWIFMSVVTYVVAVLLPVSPLIFLAWILFRQVFE